MKPTPIATRPITLKTAVRLQPISPDGLNRMVKAGKIRYIGISNCFAWQLAKANALAEKEGFLKKIGHIEEGGGVRLVKGLPGEQNAPQVDITFMGYDHFKS